MAEDGNDYLLALAAILTAPSSNPVDLEFAVRCALGREPSDADVAGIRHLMKSVSDALSNPPGGGAPPAAGGAPAASAPAQAEALMEKTFASSARVMGPLGPRRVMPGSINPGFWSLLRQAQNLPEPGE
jgi:hypothetical protein